MHPAIAHWWHAQERAFMNHCSPQWASDRGAWRSSCGPADQPDDSGNGPGGFGGDGGGGPFGVRRPLRYLAYKLDLNDGQVAALARVLDELKIERAQADVDRRRSLAAFADAVAGESFSREKADEAGAQRVASATRLRDAIVNALGQIHALLDNDQRGRFSYLIRTGALTI